MSGGPALMILKDYIIPKKNGYTRMMGKKKTLLVGVFSGKPIWNLISKSSGQTQKYTGHSLAAIWDSKLILQILNEK
jgi:hypothetical protein